MRRNTPAPMATDSSVLQWANGKTMARPVVNGQGQGRFAPLVGWHIEAGRDAGLDEHCDELRVPQVEIRHQRQGGSEIKRHWSLGEAAMVWPLTAGPVADRFAAAAGRAQAQTAQAGIVADWPAGERSYLAVRALVDVGGSVYREPLVLSAASTLTDHLYAALVAHSAACVAADAVAGYEVMPWHLGLELVPGAEITAGAGERSTEITGMAARAHDDPAGALLADDWRAYADGLAEDAPSWAAEALRARAERRERQAA